MLKIKQPVSEKQTSVSLVAQYFLYYTSSWSLNFNESNIYTDENSFYRTE